MGVDLFVKGIRVIVKLLEQMIEINSYNEVYFVTLESVIASLEILFLRPDFKYNFRLDEMLGTLRKFVVHWEGNT
jgi:hypothetical protein